MSDSAAAAAVPDDAPAVAVAAAPLAEAAPPQHDEQPHQSLGVTVSTMVARLSETAAILAAGLYVLGVLRVSGELRELHLATPTVLAGFSYHDVLMKGVGVLVSHMASSLLLGGVLVCFASNAVLYSVNRVITRAYVPNRGQQVVGAAVVLAMLLTARFWEGLAFAIAVVLMVGQRYHRRIAIGRGLLSAIMVLGVVFTGLFGSYLHAPPLMTITARENGMACTHGYLVGVGTLGQWFVAVHEPHRDAYNLEVLGANGEKVDEVLIHPAKDGDYRTVLFQITGELERVGVWDGTAWGAEPVAPDTPAPTADSAASDSAAAAPATGNTAPGPVCGASR
jgi:hypothetical protein